jgi:hypothetical protein
MFALESNYEVGNEMLMKAKLGRELRLQHEWIPQDGKISSELNYTSFGLKGKRRSHSSLNFGGTGSDSDALLLSDSSSDDTQEDIERLAHSKVDFAADNVKKEQSTVNFVEDNVKKEEEQVLQLLNHINQLRVRLRALQVGSPA